VPLRIRTLREPVEQAMTSRSDRKREKPFRAD
jgi:hypothetical protein